MENKNPHQQSVRRNGSTVLLTAQNFPPQPTRPLGHSGGRHSPVFQKWEQPDSEFIPNSCDVSDPHDAGSESAFQCRQTL